MWAAEGVQFQQMNQTKPQFWTQVSIRVVYSILVACCVFALLFFPKGWAEVLSALQFSLLGEIDACSRVLFVRSSFRY